MNLAVLGAVTIAVLKRAKPDPTETGTPGEAPPTSLPGPPSATPPPAPAPAPQVMTNVITVTNVVTLTNRPAPTPRPATNSAAPPAMTTNTAAVAATPTNTPPPSSQGTNGLAVLGLTIERPRGGKGSRLTYVTGVLQNETERKRFGVRVDLNLLDRSRQLVGMATDYTPVIEPKDTWRFRALVLDARAVTASVATIKEDQ